MCWPEKGLHKASLSFSPRLRGESIATHTRTHTHTHTQRGEGVVLYSSICQEKVRVEKRKSLVVPGVLGDYSDFPGHFASL